MKNRNQLLALMAFCGLNQKELAQKIGISSVSFSRKLNGKREFNSEEIKSIRTALNLDEHQVYQIFLD